MDVITQVSKDEEALHGFPATPNGEQRFIAMSSVSFYLCNFVFIAGRYVGASVVAFDARSS
jgi:hypothetical protein